MRQMVVTIILELEKLEKSRIEMGAAYDGLSRFNEVLRKSIGLDFPINR